MSKRWRLCVALLAGLFLGGMSLAQDGPSLATAQGNIDKVDKESLTVRPRGPDGKFEKSLVLKLTGTSKITTLSYRKQGTKMVAVQKDTEVKELMPKQTVALIYTSGPDGAVLLSAVVLPAGEK
jgi:hypothetical protein